jgi:hypothetical protein
MANGVGTLNEKPLHAALKERLALPGDRFEVDMDGYVIDIVRGDCLIEIQTRNVSAIKRKLAALAENHCLRLVYPVAAEKWIVRLADDGESVVGRRRSPLHGSVELVFRELVSIPKLLRHPNFSLEVVLMREEEVRRQDANFRNWRRRGWATQERRLLDIVERRTFATAADLAALLPAALLDPFTTRQLAEAIHQPAWLAGKMAYCLRELAIITPVGKQGNAYLYARAGRPAAEDAPAGQTSTVD